MFDLPLVLLAEAFGQDPEPEAAPLDTTRTSALATVEDVPVPTPLEAVLASAALAPNRPLGPALG